MATVERTMTVELRRHFVDTPLYKRAKKAVTSLRAHIMQHMKATDVKIGKHLNLKIWERGMRNPTHKVTFIAKKDDKGVVYAEIANIPVKKQKPAKEKESKEAKKTAEKAAAAPAKTPATAAQATPAAAKPLPEAEKKTPAAAAKKE